MAFKTFIEKAFELWMIDTGMGECPPSCPNANTPCDEDAHGCDDCMETFNRQHFIYRAFAYFCALEDK
jgi:hypothetical protein